MVGYIDQVKKVPSRQIVQVVIELPVEMFRPAVQFFDGESVFVQVLSKEMKDLPLGIHKSTLDDIPVPASVGGEQKNDATPLAEPAQNKKEPIRQPCIEAIDFCKDDDFQLFMQEVMGTIGSSEAAAKDELCIRCGVGSRREFDTNTEAHSQAQDIYRQFIDWNTNRRSQQ